MTRKIIFFNILIVIFTGCISQPRTTDIGTTMDEFYTIIYDQHKSELEIDDEKIRYAYSISQKIKNFSTDAKHLSKKELGKYASKNKDIFEKNLRLLRVKATQIEGIASRYESEKLDKKIVELKGICHRCHSELGVRNGKVF